MVANDGPIHVYMVYRFKDNGPSELVGDFDSLQAVHEWAIENADEDW